MKVLPSLLTIATTIATTAAMAQDTNQTQSNTETLLDRVVITAGEDKVAIDTPQAVTVINQEDIDSEQPTTVGDVLTDIPGVKAVGSDRVMGESFNIRGIGNLSSSDETRIIVTVDGATKFHEQYRMGSLFTDPELYKRIEVLRGPASSTLYGSGALAGVINLTTKDATDFLRGDEKFTFREKLEFNTNGKGFLTSSIGAAEPIKNLELLGSFIYRRSSSFHDGNSDDIVGSSFEAPSGLVKGKYTFGADEQHILRASYQHWTTEDNGSQYSQTGTSTGFGTVDREITDQTAILGYSFAPIDTKLVDLDVTFSYTNSEVKQRNPSLTSTSDLFDDVDYAYENWQAKVQNTMETGGANYKNFFISGLEVHQQDRTADNLTESDGQVSFHPGGESLKLGVFLQNEWVYNDKLTLIPGVRADWQELKPGASVTSAAQQDVDETTLSPKLAAHYKLTDAWGVFGSIAYTERMPVLDEIYDANSNNLNLEPEESLNYEGGFSFAYQNLFQKRDAFSAKTTVFLNQIDNLIERESTSSTYFNVGESELTGIELEASYNSNYFFSKAALSKIRGKDSATGIALNSIPADEIALTIGGRVPSENIEFGWRGVLANEQTHTSGSTTRTSGYAVHDLFASWKPDDGYLKDTEFRFGLENVLDKNYQEHLAGDPAKGRSFKITVAKQF